MEGLPETPERLVCQCGCKPLDAVFRLSTGGSLLKHGLRLTFAVTCVLGFYSCAQSYDWPVCAQQASSLAQANETFQARCSLCHAENGAGSEVGASLNVPDLRSRKIQQQDDATLRRIILEGKGDMPTFKRDFDEEEVDRLIELVRSFARREGDAGDASLLPPRSATATGRPLGLRRPISAPQHS